MRIASRQQPEHLPCLGAKIRRQHFPQTGGHTYLSRPRLIPATAMDRLLKWKKSLSINGIYIIEREKSKCFLTYLTKQVTYQPMKGKLRLDLFVSQI